MVYRLYFMLYLVIDLVQLIQYFNIDVNNVSVCRLSYVVCHTPVDLKTAYLTGLTVIIAETFCQVKK